MRGIGSREQTEGGEIHNGGIARAGDDMAGGEKCRSEVGVVEVRHKGDIRMRETRGGAVGFALDNQDFLGAIGIAVEDVLFKQSALGFQSA